MVAPIAALRRAEAILRASGDAEAVQVADGILRYQAGRPGGKTLDDVLGLSHSGGAGPWWVAEARQRRDAALREAREMHFADLSIADAAKAIQGHAHRRRTSNAPPATTLDATIDRALRCGVKFPTTAKQIGAIVEIHPPR